MGIPSLLGWWYSLQIASDYLLAVAMIGGGIYLVFGLGQPTNPLLSRLLKPLRWLGYGLMLAGAALAIFTFGKSSGAAECEAAWKEKNYEAQIARLVQEKNAKATAAAAAETSLKEIASQKETADGKVAEYQADVARLAGAVAACRRATDDDDRRMCAILGPAAAGCGNPR